VNESATMLLGAWSTFFVMLGSSSAALTGLMFVVIGMVMAAARTQRSHDGISVFSTPTVVHLGAALLVSAIYLAPWRALTMPAVLTALAGGAGIVYMSLLVFRTRKLYAYRADAEDWAWYNVLPFVAYGALCAGGLLELANPPRAMFTIAGGAVLLVFVAIHNAWDIVTFVATGQMNSDR
jgi:hypothetical protein